MKWMKAVGYGLVYFVLMFAIIFITRSIRPLYGECLCVIKLLSAVIVLTIMGQMYKLKNMNEGVLVGLVWAGIAIVLDYLVSVVWISKGNLAFYNWSVLTSYVLIVFITASIASRREK